MRNNIRSNLPEIERHTIPSLFCPGSVGNVGAVCVDELNARIAALNLDTELPRNPLHPQLVNSCDVVHIDGKGKYLNVSYCIVNQNQSKPQTSDLWGQCLDNFTNSASDSERCWSLYSASMSNHLLGGSLHCILAIWKNLKKPTSVSACNFPVHQFSSFAPWWISTPKLTKYIQKSHILNKFLGVLFVWL